MDINSPDEEEEVGGTILSLDDGEASPASYIYPSTLDSSRFRLMYITQSEDASGPVHVQLEDYAFDDRPEYETVSYTWGGENDDSTLCEPVFVGPFWDVMLSTANCSGLLQYLRYRKGSRVIWLDAICINQSNNAEKPTQISRMSDIYSACTQVVVYFGQDLVQRPSGKIFRPLVNVYQPRLSEKLSFVPAKDKNATALRDLSGSLVAILAERAGISPEQLLKRRYLSRIWVVQELVFSTQATFPLGDSDLVCKQDTAIMQLVLRRKGNNVTSSESRRYITKLLEATSHCLSSDPRDKVYAVFNLFQPHSPSNKLNSDYSISWRDCWLGVGAYMLVIERNFWLLAHAVGTDCPLQLPSWVPDIRQAGSWTEAPELTEKFREVANDPNNVPPRGMRRPVLGAWRTQFVMHTVHPFQREEEVWESQEWLQQKGHRLVFPQDAELLPLHPELFSVNSTNGALRLQVLRVFDRPCQVTAVTKDTEFITVLQFLGPSTSARFRILGWKDCGPLFLSKTYHIFLIAAGTNSQSAPDAQVMLALTTAASGDSRSVVALNACWMVHDIYLSSMDDVTPKLPLNLDFNRFTCSNNLHSLHGFLGRLHSLPRDIQMPERIELLPRILASIIFSILASNNAASEDPFLLLSRLAEVEQTLRNSRELRESLDLIQTLFAVARIICPDLWPAVEYDEFYLTFRNAEMFSKWVPYPVSSQSQNTGSMFQMKKCLAEDFAGQLSLLGVEHFDPFVAQWKESKVDHELDVVKYGFPFTIRIYLHDILVCLRMSVFNEGRSLYKVMRSAQEFSKNTNEDVESLLNRNPRPEDRQVFLEDWGPALRNELGLVWRMEEITIL